MKLRTNKAQIVTIETVKNIKVLSIIKDKIFYLWFDNECGEKIKTYGGDTLVETEEIKVSFQTTLINGRALVETSVRHKNEPYTRTTTQNINLNKLDSMNYDDLSKLINEEIKFIW